MTTKKRAQLGLGWAIALVLVTSGLVVAGGLSSANADDPAPTSTPEATTSAPAGPTPTGDPSTDASQPAAPEPSATPSQDDSPSAEPTAPEPASSTSAVGVEPAPARAPSGPVAGTYVPPAGALFNYPYGSKRSENTIRRHVLQTILATPTGGSIHLAAFSINVGYTVNAFIAAARRGVTVQVVVNRHNVAGNRLHAPSASFKKLMRTLGSRISRPGVPEDKVNFAKFCLKSCRGRGGNVHYKMFLFSSAGGADGQATKFISMMGSPNLTTLAANGQWNHLVTLTENQTTYDRYLLMFDEMKLDTPQPEPYREYNDINPPTWFFPLPGASATTDPLNRDLNQIRCTDLDPGFGSNGVTFIRIGQYAWYGNRGVWLAKTVRGLWNAGCDIAIEYAIMGRTVKRILYSPSGRGRIPMRQVATFAKDGVALTYDHAKYVTINGAWGASNGTHLTWAGTTNFSDLGDDSDESTQVLAGAYYYSAFLEDFNRIWTGPKSHVPSPRSRVPGNIAGRLGTGKYAKFEED